MERLQNFIEFRTSKMDENETAFIDAREIEVVATSTAYDGKCIIYTRSGSHHYVLGTSREIMQRIAESITAQARG